MNNFRFWGSEIDPTRFCCCMIFFRRKQSSPQTQLLLDTHQHHRQGNSFLSKQFLYNSFSILSIYLAAYPHILISSYPHILISSYPHILISSYPHILISSYKSKDSHHVVRHAVLAAASEAVELLRVPSQGRRLSTPVQS